MLKLRPATVIEVTRPEAPAGLGAPEQRLVVQLTGNATGQGANGPRAAIADVGLVGPAQVGDQVIVNVQALDLDLGSGGFDVVHVNLTRGLQASGESAANVMKLNYTSLQHAILPVEESRLEIPLERSVAVLALHGQLAAVAWAFSQSAPGSRLGYVQTEGGALPGGHSHTVRSLRERGLLTGHLTAGAAFGGEGEAVTTAGALHHGFRSLGWDAAVCGPGPGIVGSGSALGHGGMVALDSAHVSLALGCQTLLVARMSTSDDRVRHRGISHHTLTVLDLLLEPVSVALPAGMRSPVGADLRAGLGAVFGGSGSSRPALALDVERPVRITRHDWRRASVDLPAFAASGLADRTMGRGPAEDPLFFGAALAGGTALAALADSEETGADGASSSPRAFQALGGETVYDGRLVSVRSERFRHADGEEVEREIVRHRGAVAVVAHDSERVWLVRQPREAVAEPDLLELPAGRLDVEGEAPLQAAQRELAEEIGLGARHWEPILTYYSSAGFTDERVYLFAATDLFESSADSEENERIELVRWPLAEIERALADCEDAKTLIGLMWLARELNAPLQPQGGAGAEAKPAG